MRFWRLIKIDEAIRDGHFPDAEKLAKRLEVSKRTVERDIEFLRDMYEAPIEYDAKRGGIFMRVIRFF